MRTLATLAFLLALSGPALCADEEVAVVETPLGRMAWRFFEADAPGHVKYVKELIRRGFYDGTTFHRVIPHFVVQGGDPNSKNADRRDDGEGEGDRRVKGEFSARLHYRPGTVGMARDTDPDSGSCQFFIALTDLPRLDGRYSIFGELIEGLDVALKIAAVPRDQNDNPLAAVPMKVLLEKRAVPAAVASISAGVSGEVLTGPGKPRFFDPKSPAWKAPELRSTVPVGDGSPRLDLAIDVDGRVLDVRFPKVETADAAAWRAAALGWTFAPAAHRGAPTKTRVEIDGDGRNIGPATGGGAPREVGGTVAAPRPAIRVDRPAAAKPARMRLTIDAAGAVTDAVVVSGSGDPAFDEAAVAAAQQMRFAPSEGAVYWELETVGP